TAPSSLTSATRLRDPVRAGVCAPKPPRSGVRWYIGQSAVAVAGPELGDTPGVIAVSEAGATGGELPCGPVAALDPVLVHPATAAEAHTATLARRMTRMASSVAPARAASPSIQKARRVGLDQPAGRGRF